MGGGECDGEWIQWCFCGNSNNFTGLCAMAKVYVCRDTKRNEYAETYTAATCVCVCAVVVVMNK